MFICISSLKLLDKLDVLQVKAGLFKSAFLFNYNFRFIKTEVTRRYSQTKLNSLQIKHYLINLIENTLIIN